MDRAASCLPVPHTVFITGGTGYLGQSLIPALLRRGHSVRALVRPESAGRLPAGALAVPGNALLGDSFADRIAPADTFVQLVGTPRPSPAKARQFREVDLVSVRESVAAAGRAGSLAHFVYVSVARPAPVMRAYQAVRAEGEALVRGTGLATTVLQPWYVLGPGHRWPYLLLPAYWLWERFASTRKTVLRLGLLTLEEMVAALVAAIENPTAGHRTLDVPAIRSLWASGR
jgi:uncharacterized protein YbjT (DUF2867 family)